VDWQDSGNDQIILETDDGTLNNRIAIYNNSSNNQLRMFVNSNNVVLTNQGQSSTAYTGIQKIAFAYKTDDFELYRNGASISSDTSGSLASLGTLTDVDFGQTYASTAQANMWIRAVALFTTRLSDAEAYSLTGYDTYAQMANALQYTIL
jgi:7-cyano-7-deazaguanine synthase in queuosine biosynthesis